MEAVPKPAPENDCRGVRPGVRPRPEALARRVVVARVRRTAAPRFARAERHTPSKGPGTRAAGSGQALEALEAAASYARAAPLDFLARVKRRKLCKLARTGRSPFGTSRTRVGQTFQKRQVRLGARVLLSTPRTTSRLFGRKGRPPSPWPRVEKARPAARSVAPEKVLVRRPHALPHGSREPPFQSLRIDRA